MTQLNKTLLAVAVALASTQATAAGFQLNSQSATGIGRAMAGDAIIADNASVLSRNPAAMALFDEKSLSVGLTYADVSVEVSDVNFLGNELGGIENAGAGKMIPNAYYINPVNDKFAFGFAAFSNYGTGADLSPLTEGQTIVPVDLLGNTQVATINLNASMSYRINDALSLGVGLDMIQGSGELTRGSMINVDADGWAVGGIVGLTYEINENHRFGLSYRLSPEMAASGDISVVGNQFDEINIPLADIAQFAGYHQLTEKFAVHYTAQWSQWSSFDKISLHNDNAPATDLKNYHWKDSWFLSLGATYDINDKWTVRAGVAHDQGVVDAISSLSIPDSDRMWYSAGFSYNINEKSSIDFGFTIVDGEKVHVVEASSIPFLPTIDAYTDSGATYYSLQYNYKF
ncbi:OmpP1/FadL family transporter [Shewanella gaetbuli]|uniref:OmpP1/FadL family transporter n=1 Tax=Shewanella gaetbuli TaxID=220752 RepID=A0A9X2CH50_9GAMM|nr:OmpP1/FadL family transporter [Shewanella gaetbuli]MCL1141602.1 OmpP1/FadL family transporter [Shewanella gaetbuli]